MCSVTEKPASNEPQPEVDKAASPNDFRPSPRRRKETLLPEITQLALEGLCGQAIGRKLGPARSGPSIAGCKRCGRSGSPRQRRMPRRTDRRRTGPPRCDLSRGHAGHGGHRRPRSEVAASWMTPSWPAATRKRKTRQRTQPQGRNAALLARATAAVAASCRPDGPRCPAANRSPGRADFLGAGRRRTIQTRSPTRRPSSSTRCGWGLSVRRNSRVMNRDDLREVAWRLRTVIRAVGGVIPAALKDRDLGYMTRYELRIHRVRLMAAIEAFHDAEGAKLEASSPPDVESSPPAAESSRPNSPSEQHEV